MAMVLTPILKTSLPEKLNNSSPSNRVTFNIPEEDNVIEYLTNEDIPYSTKLHVILSKITSHTTEDIVLMKWIREFKDNILYLENNEKIVIALLNLNWYRKDHEFVSVYQDLILNLATAHPSFLKSVLTMVVKVFFSVDLDVEEITEAETRQFENAHKLLKNILKLVPLCEAPLCKIIADKFPYLKNPAKTLNCYVQNLLHMCSYFPSKKLTILETVIEKLIHIDALCSRNVIEMAEIQKEEEDQLTGQNLSSEDAAKKKDVMAFPIAHSLDIMMDSVFKFIQKSCFPKGDGHLDWECTKKLYKEFLTVFDKIILPTRGSVHVQYTMFYICSLRQDLSDGFLDYLWKKVQNPNIGPVYRQIAAFYIGSFLARAKYVSISTVIACLGLLCHWIHSYIDNHTAQDISVHGTFHSVCQTVFYVFAFRNQELIEVDKGLKFLRNLNFERIVTCRLNPLRYCDRNIVQNFANIARNFQIAYVYPVIEKNNRNLLYLNNEANREYNAGAMIQTFFPFDPYILKRSKHWVEPFYRIYSHCHKEKEEEEEAMDIVDEDETNVIDSLFMYGSSPGFKKSCLSRR